MLPPEIRDLIVALSVTDKNILRLYSEFPGIKWYSIYFQDQIDWAWVSGEDLSESFIRDFQDNLDWVVVSQIQTLSESFIREFSDRVNWWYVSIRQTLSEEFIREFSDRVNWWCISAFKELSEDFILEFQDLLRPCKYPFR